MNSLQKESSKQYIECVAKKLKISYEDLMRAAHEYNSHHQLVEARSLPSFNEDNYDYQHFPLWWEDDFGAVGANDFWVHYEFVTGENIADYIKESCSHPFECCC